MPLVSRPGRGLVQGQGHGIGFEPARAALQRRQRSSRFFRIKQIRCQRVHHSEEGPGTGPVIGMLTEITASDEQEVCPGRGPEPFTAEQAQWFEGREPEEAPLRGHQSMSAAFPEPQAE